MPAAIADLHISDMAKDTPNGNLATYVLGMAEKEPDMFGNSIVFTRGRAYRRDAEGNKVFPGQKDEEGNDLWDQVGGKVFVGIAKLHACDVVDDPAANDGLFSRFANGVVAAEITEFLDLNPHVWDLIEHNPSVVEALALYGDKVDGFIERYREYRAIRDKAEDDAGDISGSETTEEPHMDLEKILSNEAFDAMRQRLGIEMPDEPDEAFVLSVFQKAEEEVAAEKAARESAEGELAEVREELERVKVEPEPSPEPEPRPEEFNADSLEEQAKDNPAIAYLLAEREKDKAELAEKGSQLSEHQRTDRLNLLEATETEAESQAGGGKLNEKGVTAFRKLLRVQPAAMLALDAAGEPVFEEIDVAAEARALLASLPDDAAVPLDERTTRVHGKTVDTVVVKKNTKDDGPLSDDEVRRLARENVALIGVKVED